MTQVQAMTDQELNRALAELMGYTLEKAGSFWLVYKDGCYTGNVHYEEDEALQLFPDYCTDPAASLEVQAAAIAANKRDYFFHLLDTKGVLLSPDPLESYTAIALATPRQRAEAAYMTMKNKGEIEHEN